ncbi:F1F0 ATPase [Alishewanella tabrizica]|uniref:F1F0 ATPase n=2 Tax=Alishewanella tabrizica TaxID=671278 RepID=A0ABQ2WHU7_9ALTE|nr:F1F0 ATPase [Alishewanella tabrizica]
MLAMALLGGGILGGLFFGGLWWTVQKGLQSAHTGAWFLTSSVLRISLAVVGIYFITFGGWPRLLACLTGFISARFLIIWLAQQHSRQINNSTIDPGSRDGDNNAT